MYIACTGSVLACYVKALFTYRYICKMVVVIEWNKKCRLYRRCYDRVQPYGWLGLQFTLSFI